MKYFTVINPHSEALLIDEISLEEGASSQFRINIDGQALVLDSNELLQLRMLRYCQAIAFLFLLK